MAHIITWSRFLGMAESSACSLLRRLAECIIGVKLKRIFAAGLLHGVRAGPICQLLNLQEIRHFLDVLLLYFQLRARHLAQCFYEGGVHFLLPFLTFAFVYAAAGDGPYHAREVCEVQISLAS